jgi:hypothetical protein
MAARLLCILFCSVLATSVFAQSTIQFTAYGRTVYENDGTIEITVVRTGNLNGVAKADYETLPGSLGAPNGDYVPANGTLTFGNQESEKKIYLTLIDDNTTNDPLARTIGLYLSNYVNASEGQYYFLSLEIKDDEPPPPPLTLSYGNLTFSEGDGTTNTTLTVNLNRAHDALISVTFRHYAPPFDAGYNGTGVKLDNVQFEPGETTKQVPLTIYGNNTYESVIKTFHLTPQVSSWGVQISTPDLEITLTEDDPVATISIADISVAEGSCGPTPIEITLTADAPVNGIVHWSASDGTATNADIDYGPFGVYEPVRMVNTTTGKITLVAPYGDLNIESNETFVVTLTSATNMTIGDGSATVTIENDDEELPQFAEDLVRIEAGKSGTLRIDFPGPAPAGSVLLSSSDSRVKVPPSVIVPQQAMFVTFPADATEAAGPVTVTANLTGALGAARITATVDAFRQADLRFDEARRSAFAGETAMVWLGFSPARSEPVTVTLAASPGIVVPESAIVPANGFASVPFTSLAAGSGWITASYGDASSSLVVDVSAQTLASFAPEIAPTSGGSLVTLKGVGFSSGCTASFGDVVAETTFVDGETLTAKTPAHAADAVNLTVTCGTTPVTAEKDFRFANAKRRASRH